MKALTKAEEQVMLVVWDLGQGFLKDVMEQMPEPKPHSNTVATLLKILVEKEFMTYEVQGRNNLYKPLISKSEYGKKSASHLVKGYFEGSAAKLVSQFVSDNELNQEELENLLQQIRDAQKNQH
ncbi:BlaI/MecI/CopY family transcriptional regulator [Paraflavitalea pollutisoli]|uniref:BlaI/MecI/CopY family transcriptional regulator n=1 Tax=Paraflavitalea pollutisoli TaxID=3034143 RepID=UPI0023EAA90C|nr:BlaI/MecI/CopY family transcriptional regulator [Paraflavitalea sp. H1-2-19X]